METIIHEVFHRARPERAALAVVTQDLVEPDADPRERERQVKHFAELPVPAYEPQVLVEHRDALTHMIERGLKDFAVVLDRRVGVVEQLERRLGRNRALAQEQRQHEPGGGRSDRRGENMLGIAQQLNVGFLFRIEAEPAACREALER